MKCKICSSENTKIIYNGKIRNGGLGKYTEEDVPIYQCEDCDVIWHENVLSDTKDYYETTEYRNSLEGGSEEEEFYKLHDKETFQKFQYTGTTIFRNKKVADIGCGCGAFLDYIKGVADDVIAIEPSRKYREIMDGKQFHTYPYAEAANAEWKGQVDVVTSFDVIEHVESPKKFLEDIYELLKEGGQAIIGTPTDAPVMRALLGEIYEKKILLSTQHLWILSEKNLRLLSEQSGYKKIDIKYFQRYGMDNMLGWIRDKEPNSEIKTAAITETLNNVWKSQLGEKGLSDYIVLYLQK